MADFVKKEIRKIENIFVFFESKSMTIYSKPWINVHKIVVIYENYFSPAPSNLTVEKWRKNIEVSENTCFFLIILI